MEIKRIFKVNILSRTVSGSAFSARISSSIPCIDVERKQSGFNSSDSSGNVVPARYRIKALRAKTAGYFCFADSPGCGHDTKQAASRCSRGEDINVVFHHVIWPEAITPPQRTRGLVWNLFSAPTKRWNQPMLHWDEQLG